MDKRGLTPALEQKTAFSRMALGLHTAIPGIIEAWDTTRNLATIRPAVQMKTLVAGKVAYLNLPAIENVPACLPHSSAGGLYLTVPIKVGDACLIIFGQRAIDNVVTFGVPNGPQPPLEGDNPRTSELRHHDLSDAMFIPNLILVPTAIPNWCQDGIEIRNTAGTVKLTVKADAIYITGDVHHTGNITASGEITAHQTGTAIALTTHNHTDPQGGNTGDPIP
jgi:hypothetical protein